MTASTICDAKVPAGKVEGCSWLLEKSACQPHPNLAGSLPSRLILMKIKNGLLFLATLPAWFMAVGDQAAELPITPGPFQPTMESLTNYSCPEWFRDAKFGIWAHWGPQAVPDGGRLVCAQNVSARLARLPGSPGALWPSVHEWLEGHHSALESREMGAGETDGALQESRREIFRQHGLPSR